MRRGFPSLTLGSREVSVGGIPPYMPLCVCITGDNPAYMPPCVYTRCYIPSIASLVVYRCYIPSIASLVVYAMVYISSIASLVVYTLRCVPSIASLCMYLRCVPSIASLCVYNQGSCWEESLPGCKREGSCWEESPPWCVRGRDHAGKRGFPGYVRGGEPGIYAPLGIGRGTPPWYMYYLHTLGTLARLPPT